MSIYKKIYKKIKKADKIVIARHIGPDPDALGSSLGLKDIILNSFPDKEVYVIGAPTSKFKYLGKLDEENESMYDGLLIILDTPDLKRVDCDNVTNFKDIIKIDHHPFVEDFGGIEWVDDTASSACQMIIELCYETKLELTKESAVKLYTGLVADTGRFMYSSSDARTFDFVSRLLEDNDIDITDVYKHLYMRSYKEIEFKGYMSQNFKITPHNVGYIIVPNEVLEEYEMDVAIPGNLINDFNYIEEMLVWVTITYDEELTAYRVSIRSRGPVINEIASKYGGGGHKLASGARIKNPEDIKKLIADLDAEAYRYEEE